MDDIETLKHLVDYGVIALLVIMSFIAVFFFIERVLFYKKIDVKSYKTKKALDIALTKHLTIIPPSYILRSGISKLLLKSWSGYIHRLNM
jgi:hypothetical protein